MSDWQPIETAPKDGCFILVRGSDYDRNEDDRPPNIAFARWVQKESEDWEYVNATTKKLVKCDTSDWSYCGVEPTHWMPLPEPPQ